MFHIYKPNNKGTGHAFSLQLVGDSFIATLLKQANAGPEKKGAFSANRKQIGKEVNVKINLIEAGSIISAIERNANWNTLHDNQKKQKFVKIVFEPYFRKSAEAQEHVGYSFQVTESSKDKQNGVNSSYVIGFTFGEAQVLKEALSTGMRIILNSEYKRQKTNKDNYNKQNQTVPVAPLDAEPQPLSEEPDFSSGTSTVGAF